MNSSRLINKPGHRKHQDVIWRTGGLQLPIAVQPPLPQPGDRLPGQEQRQRAEAHQDPLLPAEQARGHRDQPGGGDPDLQRPPPCGQGGHAGHLQRAEEAKHNLRPVSLRVKQSHLCQVTGA